MTNKNLNIIWHLNGYFYPYKDTRIHGCIDTKTVKKRKCIHIRNRGYCLDFFHSRAVFFRSRAIFFHSRADFSGVRTSKRGQKGHLFCVFSNFHIYRRCKNAYKKALISFFCRKSFEKCKISDPPDPFLMRGRWSYMINEFIVNCFAELMLWASSLPSLFFRISM